MHPYAYRLLATAFFASLLIALGCGEEKLHDCIDGVDNDNDGLVDSNDLGCFINRTAEGPDRVSGICTDGLDNDGDGLADYPDDPGCYDREDGDERNTTTAVCRDGIDNDGDGLTDYPNDPGCFSTLTNDESDGCPDAPRCPQCKNGRDDDGDGTADFPTDPGCDSAADALEDKATTTDCGTQAVVTPLPASGIDSGTFAEGARGELVSASCGGTGTETVYTFEVTEPRVLLATTVVPGSPVDTVLYVRDDCRDIETEAGCNDDADPAGFGSTLQVELAPGAYFLVVDAHNPTVVGNYELRADLYIAPGAPCDIENPECLPDYVCRPRDTSTTETTCELPSCTDGIDNEGDGYADYPIDPGCIAPTDDDEADSCPGTGCPACANDVDDDGDGVADYPGDLGCTAASDVDEVGCLEETDPVEYIDSPVTAGDTTSSGNDFDPACGFSFDAGDRTYQLNISVPLQSLRIDAVSTGFFENILSVRTQGCDGTEIACAQSDDTFTSRIELVNVAPASYFITVDGAFDVEGAYELRVRGVVPAGGTCDPAQEASGLFVCASGYICATDTCVIAACNDDQDNDGDGFVDYPFDPGCSTPSDNDETDECPTGAGCPLCGNTTDDDGDGNSDYPGDLGCQSAGDNDEIDECIAGVPLLALEDSVTGVTPTSGSNFTPSCSDDTTTSESVYIFQLGLELASLTFTSTSLQGDTVLSVRSPECGEASNELACSNALAGGTEVITLTNPGQGSYYVFVDGYLTNGPVQFQLDVRGIIAEGATCDPADTQFVCAAGMVCDPAANVCRLAECNNGINDDPAEDALVDEFDTGCISSIDDSESPNPAQTPQCADGVDNDIDGTTDYPGDQGCQAAGDSSEVNCSDTDPLVTITGPVTVGSTAQAANNFVPYCAAGSAPEVVHELRVPGRLASLSANTFGSAFDTVLLLKRNTCNGNGITCNNNAAPGVLQSQITASNLNPGTYFLFVDGAGAAAGSYLLNVTGVIAQGEVCDPAQISTGLFSCIGATTCTDTGSGFLCQ